MEYMDEAYWQCLKCALHDECALDKAKRFRRIRDEHDRADNKALENED